MTRRPKPLKLTKEQEVAAMRIAWYVRNLAYVQLTAVQARGDHANYTELTADIRMEGLCINP